MAKFDFNGSVTAYLPKDAHKKLAIVAAATASAVSSAGPADATRDLTVDGALPVVAAMSEAVSAAAPGMPVRSFCFDDQPALDGHAYEGDIKESSVFIAYIGPGGLVHSGSGVIVKDSAGPDGVNRILTAAHVANKPSQFQDYDAPLEIYASTGRYLGAAQPIVTPSIETRESLKEATKDSGRFGQAAQDVAVIGMTDFADGTAKVVYGSLQGLELAPEQAPRVYLGYSKGEQGVFKGASGAPVVSPDGKIVGLVTMGDTEGVGTSLISGYDMTYRALGWDWEGKNKDGWEKEAVPTGNIFTASPITQTEVLGALGAAGRGVSVAMSAENAALPDAVIAGYPKKICQTYAVDIAATGPTAERSISQDDMALVKGNYRLADIGVDAARSESKGFEKVKDLVKGAYGSAERGVRRGKAMLGEILID